jgi:hypothetical protein
LPTFSMQSMCALLGELPLSGRQQQLRDSEIAA